MPPRVRDTYTLVAEDLAWWLDDISTKLAIAMSPQGVAPFAVALTNDQKVAYYRDVIFNPDGSPNVQGRTDLLQRLGPMGFRQVYTAVIQAYPQLRIPTPAELMPPQEAPNAPNQPQPGPAPNPGIGTAPPVTASPGPG